MGSEPGDCRPTGYRDGCHARLEDLLGAMQADRALRNQNHPFCRDFRATAPNATEPDETLNFTRNEGVPGSNPGVGSSGAPRKASFSATPADALAPRSGPSRGHGDFPSRPLLGHEGRRAPPVRRGRMPELRCPRVLRPRPRAALQPRASRARRRRCRTPKRPSSRGEQLELLRRVALRGTGTSLRHRRRNGSK